QLRPCKPRKRPARTERTATRASRRLAARETDRRPPRIPRRSTSPARDDRSAASISANAATTRHCDSSSKRATRAGGGSNEQGLGDGVAFIQVRGWPTDFNLADAGIRLGVVAFVVALLLEWRRGRRPEAAGPRP